MLVMPATCVMVKSVELREQLRGSRQDVLLDPELLKACLLNAGYFPVCDPSQDGGMHVSSSGLVTHVQAH